MNRIRQHQGAAGNPALHTCTFTLRAPGDFTATVALSGAASLYDLAALLIEAVGFEFDHAFEFCDNLKNPYRSKVRYTLFADLGEGEAGDLSVKQTRVQDVFRPRKRLGLHFDYGDDWLFLVQCDSVEPAATKRKVRKILSRTGTPPEQYPSEEEFDQ